MCPQADITFICVDAVAPQAAKIAVEAPMINTLVVLCLLEVGGEGCEGCACPQMNDVPIC